ncbi:HEAT repeat domain-containing protein [Geomonas subterranea]|uniref:HEAT repeat domain-containing protein n=1 Tax=Geomonas subterranea TaxID=2847989 RepID=A0ABX8LGF4_9BACT|nr:HEAT repeat domain-containing protein [Geomonas subterranea]QXE89770.1 HEAT repeat domain-containing protein [Geomonas subterranea]QXM08112.1 HEAT repeat domain-containing protein [Geomonas subterranea]
MIDQGVDQLDGVGKEELASVTQIVLGMTKTSKALRIYLPNNPVLIGFISDLGTKMTVHLARYGELSLDVEQFVLRYQGGQVYENRDPKESIASRLHADGIRILFFDQGVEPAEIVAFLGVLGFERASSDDDVVTQLWERNLQHIGYLTEDDFSDPYLMTEDDTAHQQRDALERIRQSLVEQPPPAPRMIPKHLLMLTAEEEGWLRKALDVEGRCNGLDDVIGILAAIVSEVQEPELFADFTAILGNLTVNLVVAGDIPHALKLARFLDRLQKLPITAPEQRHQLAAALAGILSDSTVEVLKVALDTSEAGFDYGELKELLLILGIPALGAICELLGRVEKLKVRKLIVEVLVELGREDPAVFEPFLNDPRWYLVRNVVLILSLIGTPAALKMILGLISHREPRIRREVLGFLERTADAKAKTYLLKYLRDESSALRVKALQVLTRERLSFALKPILALAGGDDFHDRPFEEKREIFLAMGELGQESVLPMLRDQLMKRYWFQKGNEKESVQLAVLGLGRVRSRSALQLLEEARSQKKGGEVRSVLDQAIASHPARHGAQAGRGEVAP